MKRETLYLIGRKNTNFVKIGITNNIDRRLSQLKEKYKDVFILRYYICPDRNYLKNLEKKLHWFCEHKRIQSEWFILETDEIIVLNSVISKFHKVQGYSTKEFLDMEYLYLHKNQHWLDSRIPVLSWKKQRYFF